jgi:hypothetical protein
MEVDVILCNHAETSENKLYVTGGGITMCFVGPLPPHVITVALGAVIHVPYELTNQPHVFKFSLVDELGNAVSPFHADGSPEHPPVEVTVPFNVGRPPMVSVGDAQVVALAANIVNLPLPQPGLYKFAIEIDRHPMRSIPFRVLTPPPGFMPTLPGEPVPL